METDNDKKLKFIMAMTKHGLQHFDNGGMVQANDTTLSGPTQLTNSGSNISTGPAGAAAKALGLANTFQAGSANLTPGTNTAQLNQSYNQNQTALNQGNEIAQTLTPQASVAASNQNILANQLLAQTQGGGPNPAQAALNQNTAANIANQAALAASQRGSSGNVGIIARQAAQQGANIQQQAVGQEATQQAQQQLSAQTQLANLSGQQVGQAQTAVNQNNQNQQGEQNILQNANSALNNNAVGMQSNINTTNAEAAGQNAGIAGKTLGGIGNAVGSVGSALSSLFAKGGTVPSNHKQVVQNYLKGGPVKAADPSQKAVVNKDSYSNDKVPAMLSEGEVVIDKDTLNDKGPIGQMARALQSHLAKKKGKK